MTDLTPAFRRPPLPRWPLTVVDAFDLTPRMRRVRLIGESLEGFTYKPGQDLVLNIPTEDGAIARRHYTIRAFDADELRLDIDFVLHGDSPATRWARAARLGDVIEAEGPRGRTALAADADWHLFIGDETGLPAILAMAETLPLGRPAFAFLEARNEAEQQPVECLTGVDAAWLLRRGPAAPSSPLLIEAVAAWTPPLGDGQAYVVGETSTVRAIRQGLIARGHPKERILAEGYWRPGRVGGHDHVFEPELIEARIGS